MRRTAVIDLGSNSARVVIFGHQPGLNYHIQDEIRQIVRLREGLTDAGLTDAAVRRAFFTLRLFRRFAESVGADEILATATSAVREAANGPEFLARVEREIGLKLHVLSGELEAFYGTLGALNAVPLDRGTIIDIGGGSAQLSRIERNRFMEGDALKLGALALTERFVRNDPIPDDQFAAIEADIERQLDEMPWVRKKLGPLVGLGGSIRNFAKIQAARGRFPLGSLNGFVLKRKSLEKTIDQLRRLPLDQRRQISGLNQDRADIILPAALVLRAVMRRLEVGQVTVSAHGLREGIFLERFWTALPYPVPSSLRDFAPLNLARFYGYAESHVAHVRTLSARLFDQLAPLHGLGDDARELLDAAALLHDLGTVIGFEAHHKHSQTLVASNGLKGFSPREVAMIALLTRYHRRGNPTAGEFRPLLRKRDLVTLRYLAAILRMAEFLERGRTGIVRDVSVKLYDEGLIEITLVADEFPAVELWDARRRAVPLLEEAYGLPVELLSSVEDESWSRLPR